MTRPSTRREFLAATAAGVVTAALAGHASATEKPPFQLGLVTYNVAATWDLATVLKTCREVGLAAVECRTTHKHGVEPTLSAADRADVRKQFADAGVKFWGCGTVCEFHAADPAVVKKNVEECKRFVDLVKDLGGAGVKVRPNGIAAGMSAEKACAQIGAALELCGRAAADAGVEIWVEVHGQATQEPKTFRAILDACGHKSVGATWNSNPTDLIDGKLDAAFDLLKPFIRSCHVNDLTNDKAGKYPYRDLFAKLRALKYDRYTLCEVGKGYEPAAGLEFLKGYKALWQELAA